LNNNILATHLYKYTIVSKNKLILDIRSFSYSLIAFFILTTRKKGSFAKSWRTSSKKNVRILASASRSRTQAGSLRRRGDQPPREWRKNAHYRLHRASGLQRFSLSSL